LRRGGDEEHRLLADHRHVPLVQFVEKLGHAAAL